MRRWKEFNTPAPFTASTVTIAQPQQQRALLPPPPPPLRARPLSPARPAAQRPTQVTTRQPASSPAAARVPPAAPPADSSATQQPGEWMHCHIPAIFWLQLWMLQSTMRLDLHRGHQYCQCRPGTGPAAAAARACRRAVGSAGRCSGQFLFGKIGAAVLRCCLLMVRQGARMDGYP